MEAHEILFQEYGTCSWRAAVRLRQPRKAYPTPWAYAAAVRRYCDSEVAPFSLIEVGFRRWPLHYWRSVVDEENFDEYLPRHRNPKAWLDFWRETQAWPDGPQSPLNGRPWDVCRVFRARFDPELFQEFKGHNPNPATAWRIIARLAHRKDVPRRRLVKRAFQIAHQHYDGAYLRKGDLARLMKAPYRVFHCALNGAVWRTHYNQAVREARFSIDWAAVARLVEETPLHAYPRTYVWSKAQGYVPGKLLRDAVPAILVGEIDKRWLRKIISHAQALARQVEEEADPATHPTSLRGLVAMSLIWPRGDRRGMAWLDYQVRHRGCSIHDAILHLPLEGRLPGLGGWISRHKDTDLALVGIVGAGWSSATESERKLPVRDLVAALRARGISDARDSGFAQECVRWGEANEERYSALERQWLDAVSQGRNKRIPVLDLEDPETGYRLRTLPTSDPRALWLGKYTNCCQHPQGAGASCAWYGLSSPDSGFWVVEKASGEIVAQSWVWATKEGSCRILVIDSVEVLGNSYGDPVRRLYLEAARQLLSTLSGVDEVRVGTGSGLQLEGEKASPVPTPPDYSGYTDAQNQVLLGRRQEISIPRMREIERAAYSGAEHMLQLQECETLQDVAEYCEVPPEQVLVLGKPDGDWYAIIALAQDGNTGEWVDAAKMPGTHFPREGVVQDLRNRGVRKLRVDARGKTAWKVLRSQTDRLGVKFTEKKVWNWAGEEMHAGVIDL